MPRRAQDAASLCDSCSKEIHEANPLAGRHVLEPVQPFTSAAAGVTLEGTRVAASANAAEIEEYRRQCEELLNAEEAAETPMEPAPSRASAFDATVLLVDAAATSSDAADAADDEDA